MFLYIKRLIVTASYLKFTQLYYRIYYSLRKKMRIRYDHSYPLVVESKAKYLTLTSSITSYNTMKEGSFNFLNKQYLYKQIEIDWNYSAHGKLWIYNLNYFDYLLQDEVTKKTGLALIYDFINKLDSVADGLMPFPISLRGINWIKFLTKYKIEDQTINGSLYAQYFILINNIEYHILGNHLLENGFSLLFGAYYFQDEKFYVKAKKILADELEEQILKDGSHFELSPMYHQIMLFRVLDCINLVQNNNWKNQELLDLLISKAKKMLDWLNTITYENGDIPLLNDSANKISPTTEQLNGYAVSLQLNYQPAAVNHQLNESGYRKIKKESYEMIIDIGNIGPDYIPGHAHSDTFNFELYIGGAPFIVDTGLSTYETNTRRTLERSTASHNTVEIDSRDQSEVWGGFRVARRAKIIYLKEDENYIEATHDGYKRIGVLHTRKFITHKDTIIIEDNINSIRKYQGIAYLHFYPGILPEIKGNKIIILDTEIMIYNADILTVEAYKYAPEFNKLIDALQVKIIFRNHLKMEIQI